MTPLNIVRVLLEATYDYATTDIAIPTDMATFLLEWNELNIPDDVLFKDDDGGKGREDEPHITVKYGLLTKTVPEELKAVVKSTAPFKIIFGKVSLFTTNPKFDVVKLDIESPELHTLNKRVSDAVPHEDTYPTYHPHATLAYVTKGSCDHMAGEDPFAAKGVAREFVASGMRFAGAGDSEDEARVVEQLLFSKTKHPGEVEESMDRVLSRVASYRSDSNHEIKALAASMVESWFRHGLTTDQMLRRLREGQWSHGMKFWSNRDKFPNAFKRFVEQAEDYVSELRETKFAETEADPFANVGFPTDPDRISQFLRSNRSRRNERTLL